jgi:hypothetical protein
VLTTGIPNDILEGQSFALLGCTRFGSPGIFGVPTRSALCSPLTEGHSHDYHPERVQALEIAALDRRRRLLRCPDRVGGRR